MLGFEWAIWISRWPRRRINEVDIALFLNSLDIFAESIFLFWACYSYEYERLLSIKRLHLDPFY